MNLRWCWLNVLLDESLYIREYNGGFPRGPRSRRWVFRVGAAFRLNTGRCFFLDLPGRRSCNGWAPCWDLTHGSTLTLDTEITMVRSPDEAQRNPGIGTAPTTVFPGMRCAPSRLPDLPLFDAGGVCPVNGV
jgi:hypothetical protein